MPKKYARIELSQCGEDHQIKVKVTKSDRATYGKFTDSSTYGLRGEVKDKYHEIFVEYEQIASSEAVALNKETWGKNFRTVLAEAVPRIVNKGGFRHVPMDPKQEVSFYEQLQQDEGLRQVLGAGQWTCTYCLRSRSEAIDAYQDLRYALPRITKNVEEASPALDHSTEDGQALLPEDLGDGGYNENSQHTLDELVKLNQDSVVDKTLGPTKPPRAGVVAELTSNTEQPHYATVNRLPREPSQESQESNAANDSDDLELVANDNAWDSDAWDSDEWDMNYNDYVNDTDAITLRNYVHEIQKREWREKIARNCYVKKVLSESDVHPSYAAFFTASLSGIQLHAGKLAQQKDASAKTKYKLLEKIQIQVKKIYKQNISCEQRLAKIDETRAFMQTHRPDLLRYRCNEFVRFFVRILRVLLGDQALEGRVTTGHMLRALETSLNQCKEHLLLQKNSTLEQSRSEPPTFEPAGEQVDVSDDMQLNDDMAPYATTIAQPMASR